MIPAPSRGCRARRRGPGAGRRRGPSSPRDARPVRRRWRGPSRRARSATCGHRWPTSRRAPALAPGSVRGAGRRPQAEGTVDMEPCAMLARQRRDGHRARRTRPCRRCRPGRTRWSALRATRAPRRSASARIRPWPSVGDPDAHRPLPKPTQPKRRQDRGVRLGADHDVDRRRTDETVALDVPADPLEDRVARGGQAGEVGHLAAGHEADAGGARQAQQVQDPARGDLLHDRRGGGGDEQRRVLVPGARPASRRHVPRARCRR